MQRSLLYIVQRVLAKLDLDEVNSIEDTVESEQIAHEAEITYYDLLSRNDWPHLNNVMTLDSVAGDNNRVVLKLPTNVVEIKDVRYDITDPDVNSGQRATRKIQYLEPKDFLDRTACRNSTLDTTTEQTINGVVFLIKTDKDPDYWTTFDNETLVFDSYDSEIETTLTGSKAQVLAKQLPTFTISDTFVPDLPAQMFPLYISELSAACSIYLRNEVSQPDERRSNRAISRMRRKSISAGIKGSKNNFGRSRTSEARRLQEVTDRPYG